MGDTIKALLENGLATLSPKPTVLLSTPDDFKSSAPTPPTVTVFLYHIGIAGEMRNAAGRSQLNGTWRRPPLPLELHFLVTPWAKTARDAYRIIGVIAQLFYDHALLRFDELQGDKVWAPDDTVEIVMESLPVDTLYDIWEPTDIPYKLSLTYLVRILGIDSGILTNTAPVAVATFPKVSV